MLLVAGLPASGKSTLAKKLGGKILEYDTLAKKFGSYNELNEEIELANRQFDLMVKFGNYDIIVDVFHTREARKSVTSLLSIKPDIILVSCPVEECVRRNSRRFNSMVSNDEIIGLNCMFEPISIDEGFNSITVYRSLNNRFIKENV